MKKLLRTPRVLLAVGCVGAALAGALIAAEQSAASMTSAATAFLASLTPEQRQQAAFSFTSDDRLRWNYVPTDMFPRKGLPIKAMTEAQRGRRTTCSRPGSASAGT